MTRICVAVCVRRIDEIRDAVPRAAQVADVVELRLDCVDEIQTLSGFLSEFLKTIDRPVILTMRSSAQGGHTLLDYDRRWQFWLSLKDVPAGSFADLELDLVRDFSAEEATQNLPIDWRQAICSHHDFSGVPDDLERIYERMAATPAAIIKVAVQADDATDCLPIFRLLRRAQQEGRELIAIAMGEAGIMTRILGPSRGSFLTYGSLDEESSTAPGQITATDLRELYRIDQIDRETEIIGIMGSPVSHSLSPRIHNAAFAAREINAVYIPFQVRNANEFMRRMVQPRSREIEWNLRGLSVTAPHKLTVMDRLDWIEPVARQVRAVNTIVVSGDELHGYNTDTVGFIQPLREKFGSLKNARCAIIGAGGAARAALWTLRREGARVGLFARDPTFAEYFAREFSAECKSLADASFSNFDVVINATPLGTRGQLQNETPASAKQLRGVRLAYDLVYNPLETRFIREARDAGCQTLSGIEMLLAQAVEQFKLWTGKTPDIEVMRSAALAGRRLNDLQSET